MYALKIEFSRAKSFASGDDGKFTRFGIFLKSRFVFKFIYKYELRSQKMHRLTGIRKSRVLHFSFSRCISSDEIISLVRCVRFTRQSGRHSAGMRVHRKYVLIFTFYEK